MSFCYWYIMDQICWDSNMVIFVWVNRCPHLKPNVRATKLREVLIPIECLEGLETHLVHTPNCWSAEVQNCITIVDGLLILCQV